MTKQIEKIIRGFLWCQGEMKAGKAKVSWEVVCRAKVESGLGIQSLVSWNKALMTTHIWNVHAQKESLWVIWIHCYRLNKFNFWEIGIKNDLSFAWRKILQLRSLIRPFIRYKIGNDKSRSSGFDTWEDHGPIRIFMSNRDIARASFSLVPNVSDIVDGIEWRWPEWW